MNVKTKKAVNKKSANTIDRGYWIPPCSDQFPACDGFYVKSDAVFTETSEEEWDTFLNNVCKRMCYKEQSLHKVCAWKNYCTGQSLLLILQNRHVDIIAEALDDYIAIYILIPRDCAMPGMAKRSFSKYLNALRESLIELYPGKIRKRINSQRTKVI